MCSDIAFVRVFLDTNVLVSAFASRGLCAEVFELVLLDHDLIVGRNVLRELDKALREKIKLPAARSAEIVDFVSSEATQVVDKAEPANANVDAADALVLGEALAGQAESVRHRRRGVAAARGHRRAQDRFASPVLGGPARRQRATGRHAAHGSCREIAVRLTSPYRVGLVERVLRRTCDSDSSDLPLPSALSRTHNAVLNHFRVG